MPTLLESLTELGTPALLSKAATTFGESEGGVSRALGAAFPILLGGIAGRAGDQGFLRQVMDLVSDRANDASVLKDASRLVGATGGTSSLPQIGSNLLTSLFGDRLGGLATALGEYAGIRGSSASALLAMASPLVMGVLGDRIRKEGLGLTGLANMLLGQKDTILAAVPGALTRYLAPATLAPPRQEERSGGWLWPLLLVPLGLGLLWWLTRGPAEPIPAPSPFAAARPALPNVDWPDLGAFVERMLPNNVELNIPERGIESRLLAFITDPAQSVSADTWFDFDRLLFDPGSATLRPQSQEQLRNIAEILKAYPAVVRIGGYTDNTGDPEANLQLSRSRAQNVRSELIVLGVDASQLEAEGYGDQHPVADNTTEAGRAKNRRISLRVTRK